MSVKKDLWIAIEGVMTTESIDRIGLRYGQDPVLWVTRMGLRIRCLERKAEDPMAGCGCHNFCDEQCACRLPPRRPLLRHRLRGGEVPCVV